MKKFIFLLGASLILFSSCTKKETVNFPVNLGGSGLYGTGKKAIEGKFDLSTLVTLSYSLDRSIAVPPSSSLEIEYSFSAPVLQEIQNFRELVLRTSDGGAWALPIDVSFLGQSEARIFHYAVPLSGNNPESFTIGLNRINSDEEKKSSLHDFPVFEIRSVKITEKWYGFRLKSGGEIFATPFVYQKNDDGIFIIDAPGKKTFNADIRIEVSGNNKVIVEAGNSFEAAPVEGKVHIPAGVLQQNAGQISLKGDGVNSFVLSANTNTIFPDPVSADPGIILAYDTSTWRNNDYEVFRWEGFPSILIFDTINYAIQDRLLKRLAFFVEKAGFRGRLAPDSEIASLHGWNAHDYRAEDLARFFEAARVQNFPLLDEERQLEEILIAQGIIVKSTGGIIAGEGAFISISRESENYLRNLFIVHEGFHGLFFVDEDFRDFSRRRWDLFDAPAKRFLLSYFSYQGYDIKDEYLVVNEFMAHILQQGVSQASKYFGQTLPSRLESSPWRRSVLGEKDEASGAWPYLAKTFTEEAAAFSAYTENRWSLAAGRVRRIQVK